MVISKQQLQIFAVIVLVLYSCQHEYETELNIQSSSSSSSYLLPLCVAFATPYSSSSSVPFNTNNNNNKISTTKTNRKSFYKSDLLSATPTSTESSSSSSSSPKQSYDNNEETVTSSPSSSRHDIPIPITIVSGFLGCGKTTFLRNLLLNKDKLRIAIVVNDVASINIDSKLVSRYGSNNNENDDNDNNDFTSQADGIVELQNGCACCSKSDELLSSIAELVTLNDLRSGYGTDETGNWFDHIVIEMSGIADPAFVRTKFQYAQLINNMPLLDRVQLSTMITIVDCTTYQQYMLSNTKYASKDESPELYPQQTKYDYDDIDYDTIPESLRQRLGYDNNNIYYDDDDENSDVATSGVSALLSSQTEIADIVILNKVDMVEEDVESTTTSGTTTTNKSNVINDIQAIVSVLNPKATILQSSYGKVPISSVLGIIPSDGYSIATSGIIDDHRDIIQAALSTKTTTTSESTFTSSHSHSHEHDTTPATTNDSAKDICTDPTHDHSHADHDTLGSSSSHNTHDDHNHHHIQDDGTVCTDPKHDHDHSSHSLKEAVIHDDGTACTDPTHDHSHDSNNHLSTSTTESTLNEPFIHDDGTVCTDPTHDHSHDSNYHLSTSTTNDTTNHAGIGTFVYQARRPFHPQRFLERIINNLPIRDNTKNKTTAAETETETIAVTIEPYQQVLQKVIRSKGFLWLASSNVMALYWSHAGITYDLSCLGGWWATLDRAQWPSHAIESILQDFDNVNHTDDDRNNTVDTTKTTTTTNFTVGDRRQELVFIGMSIGTIKNQQILRSILDECLLDDGEWILYLQNRNMENFLQDAFPNHKNIPIQMLS